MCLYHILNIEKYLFGYLVTSRMTVLQCFIKLLKLSVCIVKKTPSGETLDYLLSGENEHNKNYY